MIPKLNKVELLDLLQRSRAWTPEALRECDPFFLIVRKQWLALEEKENAAVQDTPAADIERDRPQPTKAEMVPNE